MEKIQKAINQYSELSQLGDIYLNLCLHLSNYISGASAHILPALWLLPQPAIWQK